MELTFLHDAANGVLASPNDHLCGEIDAGKKQALIHGHTVRFTTAGELLGDLAALDSDASLRRRLRHYAAPDLLVIDEIGYLSYSNRHADLLFELVSRRFDAKSTLVTTNKAFAKVVNGVSQCSLRRILGGSPSASFRVDRDRGGVLPFEGGERALGTAQPQKPGEDIMKP